MKLADYFDEYGKQSELAVAIGISPVLISQWVREKRPIPQGRCPEIEKVTQGQVTCEELRDDVSWVRIKDKTWPHPKGRPLVDHASKTTA